MTPTAEPSARPIQPAFMRLEAADMAADLSPDDALYLDPILGGLRLGDQNATAILPSEPSGTLGGVTRPTGLAVGPQGRLLLADPGNNLILSYTTSAAAFTPLWPARQTSPPDAYSLLTPRGLAFSPQGDLLVADSGHDRVIVYTWPHLGVRAILDLPGAEPWDLDFDSQDRLYVAASGLGRVLRFDRLLRQDLDYLGGAGQLIRPRHLAFDKEEVLFVLDDGLKQVKGLDAAGGLLDDEALHLFERSFPPPLRLEPDGLWLPQDLRPNCPALHLVDPEVDRKGRLKGTQLPLLALPHGIRYPRYGQYRSHGLDSGLYNCAWHRLVLDVDLPEGSSLRLRTYTAPAPLDPARLNELPLERWSIPLTIRPGDFPEALIQSPPGQYLWLWIEFSANGEVTPRLRSTTLYAPRQSSLAYLPPVFKEEATSADFLDRFLSYFDTLFAEIETQIEAFPANLDPMGVPSGDFLAWLASWLDITFLAEWPEATRRAFVRDAIRLYRQRGTLAGVQAMIRLHTGLKAPYPVIIEHYRLRRLTGSNLYLGGAPFLYDPLTEIAHHFTLIMPAQIAATQQAEDSLRRFIDVQKPAHTRYRLLWIKPSMRVGCQAALGVDAILGRYTSLPVDEMVLDQNSLVSPGSDTRPRLGYFRIR